VVHLKDIKQGRVCVCVSKKANILQDAFPQNATVRQRYIITYHAQHQNRKTNHSANRSNCVKYLRSIYDLFASATAIALTNKHQTNR